MEKYNIIEKIGEGSYGVVWQAIDTTSGDVVAIKRIKEMYNSWEECLNLREVKSLAVLKHPNIVQLREVVREYGILYFVFEYMESNLLQVMKAKTRHFTVDEIKNLSFQVFQGLAYMHRRGYFHRDLKPENLLVSKDKIKIGDLGMAREIFSGSPCTGNVTMRWYRAPEVLLQSHNYNYKIDMWAMGAIMAEMFGFRPIFPGRSPIDQITKICKVIGTPTTDSWPEGIALARVWGFEFPELGGIDLSVLLPSASKEAVDLSQRLLTWDPANRPMAADVLQHPFFKSCYKFDTQNSLESLLNRCGMYNVTTRSEELSLHFSCPKFLSAIANGACLQNGHTEARNYGKDFGNKPVPFVGFDGYFREPKKHLTGRLWEDTVDVKDELPRLKDDDYVCELEKRKTESLWSS